MAQQRPGVMWTFNEGLSPLTRILRGRNLGDELPVDVPGHLRRPTHTNSSHLGFCLTAEVGRGGGPDCGPGSRGFESPRKSRSADGCQWTLAQRIQSPHRLAVDGALSIVARCPGISNRRPLWGVRGRVPSATAMAAGGRRSCNQGQSQFQRAPTTRHYEAGAVRQPIPPVGEVVTGNQGVGVVGTQHPEPISQQFLERGHRPSRILYRSKSRSA
ncbi:hypothetical protein JOF56_009696 [Kibdelosporangium banguiense]|uniref:Uncharacterized protein n=1 Tax=Kibdelosporangium banguiense TaxID=1365924 RepID=A0ABS4TY37_9PSEU|nr:hypothetical protein [Kibdelosporangium banguiense]